VPDKELEKLHLELLRAVVPDFPVGAIEGNRERPDFIVHGEDKTVAVEVTTFHLPPVPGRRPRSEVVNLKRRVVDLAWRKHRDAGGPALYVSVHFHHEPTVTKANAETRANELLQAIRRTHLPRSINEGHINIGWPALPEGIVSVSVMASVDGKDSLWHATEAGWVVQLQPADVQRDIEKKKKRMFAAARAKCDVVWLVIVNDMSRSEPVELSDSVARAVVTDPFDRVLWFEPHCQKAWVLGTAEVFCVRTGWDQQSETL
jgi:hypothetical protein